MLAFKHRGMTLPEILIVLMLLAGSFALVAPLTVESLDKRKQKLEQIELSSDLKHFQNKAKWQNQTIELDFSGQQVIVKTKTGKPIQVKKFKEISFRKQKLTINASGLASRCELLLDQPSKSIRVLERLCLVKSDS